MGQRTMPAQKPGNSKQSYGTPADFLDAAKRRLGIFQFGLDIAASPSNAVAARYFTKKQDCFAQPSWRAPNRQGWSWLNPEFDDIERYAKRCFFERQVNDAQIAFLTPASVGANWYRDFVHNRAFVLALNGRITFKGQKDPYPKDCILSLFSPFLAPGFDVWNWNPAGKR